MKQNIAATGNRHGMPLLNTMPVNTICISCAYRSDSGNSTPSYRALSARCVAANGAKHPRVILGVRPLLSADIGYTRPLMSRVVLMSCPTSWYHPTEKSSYGPLNRYGTNSSFGMSANTSSGIAALLIVNSRKSLIMTEDSRPDLVWCLSNPANSRTKTASTMFVAAVNAETPASIILPSTYSPHSALYPSSSDARPTYIIATSNTFSLHTQSKQAIAAHSSCNVLASNPPVHAPLASYSAAGEVAPSYAVALPFHWPRTTNPSRRHTVPST
mmetsp:Transcript_2262/g.9654  ORF Transcript_2262/g.9654 Transcript_2262/m.9654 type:complete len:272 (+) Transcript_2262:3715-4530(+)